MNEDLEPKRLRTRERESEIDRGYYRFQRLLSRSPVIHRIFMGTSRL